MPSYAHALLTAFIAVGTWGNVLAGESSCEAIAPEQTWYVLAYPRLNIRSLDADRRILETVEYGEALELLARTGRRDTVNGLPGEWVQVRWVVDGRVHVEGQVFDAYLWPVEVPLVEQPEAGVAHMLGAEWFAEYGERVVDAGSIRLFGHTYENYGGPSGDRYYLEVECTQGQAMQMLRTWVHLGWDVWHASTAEWLGIHADTRPTYEVEEMAARLAQWDRIMHGSWTEEDGAPWTFTMSSEGGSQSWTLERKESYFVLSYTTGSC